MGTDDGFGEDFGEDAREDIVRGTKELAGLDGVVVFMAGPITCRK
jgi:hypothetical protein